MLKYYCNIGDINKDYEVEVHEDDGGFKVVIDGLEHKVDFYKSGDNLYSIIIDNVNYEVDIAEKDNKYEILRHGDLFCVEILDELKKMIKERGESTLSGRQVIEAQMPGVIQKVLVKEEDEVKTGDPLLVLIAMKMENEITAPKDGVVQEILVKENETVSNGDKLIIVE